VENLVEEVDTEISSSDGSSKDEDLSLAKPVTHPHLHTLKSMKTQSHGSTSTKPHTKHEQKPKMENTYDLSTCCEWPN
jgi:hypothetical protein